ncbi:MAG: hypothetical protein WCE94_15510 [Candidatus Methanoperedens sp.]
MSWIEIFQIIAGVIVSVGGAGAIILALSSFLGKMWAEKHLESIKTEFQKEIEAYKSQLDILNQTSLRYSGQQFELYNKLWHSLYDLKLAADTLWDEANEPNLRKFSQQLKKTIDEIEKSYLFIEESHYQALIGLLEQFSKYQFGKIEVIQYSKRRSEESLSQDQFNQLINNNRERKQNYEGLINEIRIDLKRQIRGGR